MVLDMERSHGEERIKGKCRKDKGHDLWYRPGPLTEFRSTHALSVVQEEATKASTAIAANFGFAIRYRQYKSKMGLQYQRILPYSTQVQWDISDLPFVRNKDYQ